MVNESTIHALRRYLYDLCAENKGVKERMKYLREAAVVSYHEYRRSREKYIEQNKEIAELSEDIKRMMHERR